MTREESTIRTKIRGLIRRQLDKDGMLKRLGERKRVGRSSTEGSVYESQGGQCWRGGGRNSDE